MKLRSCAVSVEVCCCRVGVGQSKPPLGEKTFSSLVHNFLSPVIPLLFGRPAGIPLRLRPNSFFFFFSLSLFPSSLSPSHPRSLLLLLALSLSPSPCSHLSGYRLAPDETLHGCVGVCLNMRTHTHTHTHTHTQTHTHTRVYHTQASEDVGVCFGSCVLVVWVNMWQGK